MTKSMTDGNIWKHIIKFTLPIFFGSLLQQLYNTVDTIVVGNFCGEESLAAVGTTANFTFIFLAIAIGFSAGTGVLVSQSFGAKNEEYLKNSAKVGIIFILTLGIVMGIFGVVIARPAYKYLVNVPSDFLELTIQYFVIYSLGLVFQYGYNIFSAILRSVGDSAATLYFLLIASILNIFLDIVFVKYFGLGVVGVAIATDISQAVSFICAYIYMRKKYRIFKFKFNEYIFNKTIIKKIIEIGLPIALQLIVVSLGLVFIQRAVNDFGKSMTASFTVGQRVELYLRLPCNAFQTTMATFVGQNIGAKKIDRVKIGVRDTMLISLFLTGLIAIFIFNYSNDIISFFGISNEAAELCNQHLKTISIINIVLSMYVPIYGVFQGANHSKVPTFIVLCALFTRVLVTYLFRYTEFFGKSIIWWNGLFGFGIGFIITWSYYFSNKWQEKSNIS